MRRGRLTLIRIVLALAIIAYATYAHGQTTGTLMPNPKFVGLDNNGNPLSGGKLYTYEAGTSTPLPTYSDSALTIPNTNPVILDSGGRPLSGAVYLSQASYKFVLKDADEVTIWTQDNVGAVPQTTIASSYNDLCNGRVTLTTVTPVPTSDVTGATTVYFTPYKGNRCALHDGSTWNLVTFTEVSLSLGSDAANTNYDLFLFSNGGVATLERVAWTNNTTRATAIVLQDGVLVKSGDSTRRYLGTYRTTSVAGQTEDSRTKRFVWNMLNRVDGSLRVADATDSWQYTTATWRQANNSTANQVGVVIGVVEDPIRLQVVVFASNTNADVSTAVGIGEDSTTAPHASVMGMYGASTVANIGYRLGATLDVLPSSVGFHFYAWLEHSNATGTTTWRGDGGIATLVSGLSGTVRR